MKQLIDWHYLIILYSSLSIDKTNDIESVFEFNNINIFKFILLINTRLLGPPQAPPNNLRRDGGVKGELGGKLGSGK